MHTLWFTNNPIFQHNILKVPYVKFYPFRHTAGGQKWKTKIHKLTKPVPTNVISVTEFLLVFEHIL